MKSNPRKTSFGSNNRGRFEKSTVRKSRVHLFRNSECDAFSGPLCISFPRDRIPAPSTAQKIPHLMGNLGPVQTSNFSCAESNANEEEQ